MINVIMINYTHIIAKSLRLLKIMWEFLKDTELTIFINKIHK